MKKLLLILFISLIFTNCKKEDNNSVNIGNISDGQIGYAIGEFDMQDGPETGKLGFFKTNDGGITWDLLSDESSLPSGDIFFVDFVSEDVGYKIIADSNGIFKTINGGFNWTLINNMYLEGMSFPTEDLGYATDGNNIYKTNNGGVNWSMISNPGSIRSFNFPSENIGYYLDYDYKLYKSTNGGVNWSMISNLDSMVGSEGSYHIDFPSEETGYFTDEYNIIKTTDGGLSWSVFYPAGAEYGFSAWILPTINFVSDNLGYVMSHYGIYKTTDGGLSCNLIYNNIITDLQQYNSLFIYSVEFP